MNKMKRLIEIGKIKPKSALQVKKSKLGIGFEKLDRDVFDPEKAYDRVAQLGVKWIRLQSGWAKTETTKGVYDFKWLDNIIENLLSRGLKPWICLAYGNGIYTPEAAKVFGAVGVPPFKTDEERNAWKNYVSELAKRYIGKVEHFEVWNEPNWFWSHIANEHHGNGKEYGEFVVLTSKAIKSANPNAKIIGGVESVGKIEFINNAFEVGMGNHIDYFSYHIYTPDDKKYLERRKLIQGMLNIHNPKIKLIQGETGAPSRSDGNGELSWGSWTPKKQAKTFARHAIADLAADIEFASYFSCMDMIEALSGKVGVKNSYMDYGYFGVLEAEFDEDGFSIGEYTPKLSYTTLQTIASVFSDDFDVLQLPFAIRPQESKLNIGVDTSDNIISYGFKKPNGSYGFAYWHSSDIMTSDFFSTVTFETGLIGKPKLIDLMYGKVYDLTDEMVVINDGVTILKNIPINDYPMLITFGDFFEKI